MKGRYVRAWPPQEREARELAKESNIAIFARHNSAGEVVNYTVWRMTKPRPAFIGNPITAAKLLELVRRCAKVAA